MHFTIRRSVAALSVALALAAPAGRAADLMDVWRAAQQHDLDFASAGAAHRAGEARRTIEA